MEMLLPTPEQQQQLDQSLNTIAEMYLYLKHKFNFDQDLLEITRTDEPDDKDPVCFLEFVESSNDFSINVTVTDKTFTPDDMYEFLQRAEGFIRQQIDVSRIKHGEITLQ